MVSGTSDTWSPISSSDMTSNSVMEKGIHSKVKAAVAQWKKKNPVEGCLTLTTRSSCQFPFTFNKRMYSSCTTAGHPIGRPWCFTQVIKYHINQRSKYYCTITELTDAKTFISRRIYLTSLCYRRRRVSGISVMSAAQWRPAVPTAGINYSLAVTR